MRHRRPTRTNTVTTYHEETSQATWLPGAEPGIDTAVAPERLPAHFTNLTAACDIQIVDFSDSEIHHVHATNATLDEALMEDRPEGSLCRWVSVNGLDSDVITSLSNNYNLHRLAIEDLIQLHSRTKVDWYTDQAFVVLTLQKLVRLHQHRGQDGKCDCPAMEDSEDGSSSDKDDSAGELAGKAQSRRFSPVSFWSSSKSKRHQDESPIKPIRTLHRYESAQIPEHTAFMEKHSVLADEELAVSVEQVSIFLLADNTIISFFEQSAQDVETPLLTRLDSPETMLRRSCDASLMLQALIDAIVDLAVPVKEAYNKARKELQVDAMTFPDIKTSRKLHIFGEEIDMLQNLFKPIVHLVNALRDHNAEPLPPRNRDGIPAPIYNRSISSDALRRHKTLHRTPTSTATTITITPLAHTYFGDVLDHCITMIQALEQMDASAQNISTLIFNTVGAKNNNLLMIFTVVTVLFVPLTFVSGYFGMNFNSGGGIDHPFAWFWVVAGPVLVGFTALVAVTAGWDWIKDLFVKKGIRRLRRRRGRDRARTGRKV
ncbi:hypothetical protein BAUCODRAFT_67314 [Baudoinia panamericana UAMH 10762]|uniref:Uncharacterized protein n=1 Tax=Baudoinia panamericana (strain UAMH 10762) TaxID=717646 RepID=M2NHF2_BAUPA|nr:uncharacterized protein BAUCODRAFT_67314 [Baudoinia panamericana UAMH 10762]EMC98455.1 hypothetical protein BAUCODRAFT_67314 [Baudoinia panamericana UAMH 10762]